jgi:hypothetical protein
MGTKLETAETDKAFPTAAQGLLLLGEVIVRRAVLEIQETANLQILSFQKSLFSSGAFLQRLAGQGDIILPGG